MFTEKSLDFTLRAGTLYSRAITLKKRTKEKNHSLNLYILVNITFLLKRIWSCSQRSMVRVLELIKPFRIFIWL